MKCILGLFVLVALFTCGCRTYLIDSNPQGLRVTINDIEYGVTPVEYETVADYSCDFYVEVTPPSRVQLRTYEEKNDKIVSTWYTGKQSKHIYPDDSPSGTIFFQFILSEYDTPKTKEELEWIEQQMDADAESLRRQQGLLKDK